MRFLRLINATDWLSGLKILAGLVPFLGLLVAAPAFADASGSAYQDFTTYTEDVVENVNTLPNLFAYVCYILGAILVGLGVQEARRVIDGSGGGSMTWRHPAIKLFAGGLFVALPYAVNVLKATMAGDDISSLQFFQSNAFTFAGGLDINDNGLSGILANGINNMGVLLNLSAFLAYVIGVWFVLRGIQMTRLHVENPGNAPLAEGLKRLGAGGALISFPMIANVVRNTFGASGSPLTNTAWNVSDAGEGLDGMMVRFVQDIATPAYYAIEIFCFVAGVVMILFAMQRLVRTAQDGPRGPLGLGTIVMFIISGLLISFPQLLSALDSSLTGFGQSLTRVDIPFMSESGSDAGLKANAQNVFSAVLAFMAVVGFLSVVRGLFMLKVLAEGGQATLMQVTVHLVAGSLAINLGAFINAVQASLGLSGTEYGLLFN